MKGGIPALLDKAQSLLIGFKTLNDFVLDIEYVLNAQNELLERERAMGTIVDVYYPFTSKGISLIQKWFSKVRHIPFVTMSDAIAYSSTVKPTDVNGYLLAETQHLRGYYLQFDGKQFISIQETIMDTAGRLRYWVGRSMDGTTFKGHNRHPLLDIALQLCQGLTAKGTTSTSMNFDNSVISGIFPSYIIKGFLAFGVDNPLVDMTEVTIPMGRIHKVTNGTVSGGTLSSPSMSTIVAIYGRPPSTFAPLFESLRWYYERIKSVRDFAQMIANAAISVLDDNLTGSFHSFVGRAKNTLLRSLANTYTAGIDSNTLAHLELSVPTQMLDFYRQILDLGETPEGAWTDHLILNDATGYTFIPSKDNGVP